MGLKGAVAIPASNASGKTGDEVSRKDEGGRSKHRSEGAQATERGAQQGPRVVATGALEVFAVDPQTSIYKRSTEALATFTVDLSATMYTQTCETQETFATTTDSL
ncbi:hypothetical protein C469_09430 [Halorubrum lipolyticum DSM 21995]|uniref:Uncharacterized protein n=1 Tax=Halorubrum lipolyticum DSM 21995 TaxID=1227482 RepID=M0NR82_9EURY|nr:hypothetical protein C469_09430 [Halorubrum lipolyticum DSM 21995]